MKLLTEPFGPASSSLLIIASTGFTGVCITLCFTSDCTSLTTSGSVRISSIASRDYDADSVLPPFQVPTPFASHAFHFCDGFAQSFPYHLFITLFPLHRFLYLGLFVAVNFWSIFVCPSIPPCLNLDSYHMADRSMILT